MFYFAWYSFLLSFSFNAYSACQDNRWNDSVQIRYKNKPNTFFYKVDNLVNGLAPVTYAPSMTVSSLGAFTLPITVTDFSDIGAITLHLEYDPAVITYLNSFTKNAVFGSSFLVGNNPGIGGKMQIVIQWYGGYPGVFLPNGATLCTLNFSYSSTSASSTLLNWIDFGPSCEYSDGSGTVLTDTPTASYYINGSVTIPLTANFSADNLTPPKNTTVYFTDLSFGGATSWNWSFNRTSVVFVNGTSSSSQNPRVQFTDGGLYTVTLVAHNGVLNSSLIKTDYIRAGISGLWTGNTSSDWYTLSNWDNYLLPLGVTNVVIPPVAGNWPVFAGDLTLGIHCGNLTLSGTSSKMTITGVLTIP